MGNARQGSRLRSRKSGEGVGETRRNRRRERHGVLLRVTFRGALVEVAAVEHRAGPEVLQVLGRRLGGLWEVGFQGPAGREAAQPGAAGWRGVQVRCSVGGPLGAWRLFPRSPVGTGCLPHGERRAALRVHAGSGRTGRRGSGAPATRAACESLPRGRDLGSGARSPRERRAPRGVGGRRGGRASDLMLELSTSRAAPRGLTPRSPGTPRFTPSPVDITSSWKRREESCFLSRAGSPLSTSPGESLALSCTPESRYPSQWLLSLER